MTATTAAAATAWRVAPVAAVILFGLLGWELLGTLLSGVDTILRTT